MAKQKKVALISQGMMAKSACPRCNKVHDGFTATEISETGEIRGPTRRPIAGAITLCNGCATILVFADAEGALRLPTQDEMAALRSDDAKLAVVKTFQQMLLSRLMSPHRVLH